MWTRWLKHRRELIWTYSPLTTRFYDLDAPKGVVYHAVDAIDAQPGMPAETIREAEAELAERADIIFTTAHEIQNRLSRLNPNTHYFSNVADFEHFAKARSPNMPVPSDMASLPEPRIIFVGAISAYKLDTGLIAKLAALEPSWSFVMIGDVGEGDPMTNVPELYGAPNIHMIGPKPYARLPEYLSAADAAIIPSPHNPYTASMFPMKFFEYLAAGLPVVATRLPALRDHVEVAAFSDDAETFRAHLVDAIEGRAPPLERRLEVAMQQTYETRTAKMMAIVRRRNDT
jgi:glycosyltransferase involved in cell wall biosynthesis